VVPPTLAAVLGTVPGRAVVLPAFLASGYHVRTDLPAQLATIGRIGQLSAAGRVVQLGAARRLAGGCDVLLAPALGPDPLVVAALADRARAAGWRPGDSLVLAAAGSRDPAATADVRAAAALLSARLGTPVPIGYVAAEPSVSTVVAAQHRRGRRVVIASYLLAPGHFHDRLASMGATAVAAPLGDHPDVVMALCTRYHAALPGFTPRRLTGNLSRRGTGG
jgi:sirohydrochlorin ferrochelatase